MRRFITTQRTFKEHPVKIILASLFILSFAGLQLWNSYAPLSVHEWNKKEIARIKVAHPDDFTFAVFGDNKGNYSFFEPLLRDIEHDKKAAFAIDDGDLVSGGKRGHFRSFLKQVQRNLTIPFLTAIGNHDLDDGSGNYQDIFGPTSYAFVVGQYYFIVLDTSTGFDKVERRWLEDELKNGQTSKACFVFMHIPLFDPRSGGFYLPEKDGKDFLDLFRRYKVSHLFASHIHGYFSGVWEGVPYTITGGAGARLQGSDPEHFFHHYVQVHVYDGKIETTVVKIDREGVFACFFDLMKDHVLKWGLLLGAGISLLALGLSLLGEEE